MISVPDGLDFRSGQCKKAPPVEQEPSVEDSLSGSKGSALSARYPVSVMHQTGLGKKMKIKKKNISWQVKNTCLCLCQIAKITGLNKSQLSNLSISN